MEQFIGCDAHKKVSVFVAVDEKGRAGEAIRVTHDRQLCREFLGRLRPHSMIAVEASGHYGWLVDDGTLPEVWIPPSELREQRELLRLRIFLVRLRTQVKNRIHGTLARHNGADTRSGSFRRRGSLEVRCAAARTTHS